MRVKPLTAAEIDPEVVPACGGARCSSWLAARTSGSTNAIESLNASYRRATAHRHFPTEQAALKCLYLLTLRGTLRTPVWGGRADAGGHSGRTMVSIPAHTPPRIGAC